jgi:hypothetical protein
MLIEKETKMKNVLTTIVFAMVMLGYSALAQDVPSKRVPVTPVLPEVSAQVKNENCDSLAKVRVEMLKEDQRIIFWGKERNGNVLFVTQSPKQKDWYIFRGDIDGKKICRVTDGYVGETVVPNDLGLHVSLRGPI